MGKKLWISALEGVLRGFIITVILLLIFAVVMTFLDVSEGICSIYYLVATILSIMYGSIFAVKKTGKRGWLTGLLVALIYMVVLYTVSVISGNGAVVGVDRLERLGLALVTGVFSGMMGINL